MTIVRELITRLAFQVDQSGINKVNHTISGFKSGLEGVVSQAFSFGEKVINFFSGLSQEAIAFKDIADTAAVSVKELAAIRISARQFGINPEQFNRLFADLNENLRQARQQQGPLVEVAREQGIQYRKNNGQIKTGIEYLKDYLEYSSKIEDRQKRIYRATAVFGAEFAPRVADIANNVSKFNEGIAKSQKQAQTYADSIDELKKLEIAKQNAAQKLTNIQNEFLKILLLPKDFGEKIKKSYEKFTPKNVFGAKTFSSKQSNSIFFGEQNKERIQNLAEKTQNNSQVNINNQNQIVINVPAGTNQEQLNDMETAVNNAMKSFMQTEVRAVVNNNPQME